MKRERERGRKRENSRVCSSHAPLHGCTEIDGEGWRRGTSKRGRGEGGSDGSGDGIYRYRGYGLALRLPKKKNPTNKLFYAQPLHM